MSILSPDDVARLFWLFERQLEELCVLREESVRQTDLLHRLLASSRA